MPGYFNVVSLALLLLAAGSGNAAAEPRAYDESVRRGLADVLSTEIAQVSTAGSWNDGQRHGTHRAVLVQIVPPFGAAARYVRSVYVQWLEDTPAAGLQIGQDPPPPRIVATTMPLGRGSSSAQSIGLEWDAKTRQTILRVVSGERVRTFALAGPGELTEVPSADRSGTPRP